MVEKLNLTEQEVNNIEKLEETKLEEEELAAVKGGIQNNATLHDRIEMERVVSPTGGTKKADCPLG
ncbi:MAG: hypothetical protein GY756_19635 [bacterium]|nr:hypothetical protein [bacterium]